MAYSEDHIALAAEYALGTLDADERALVETMLIVDPGFLALVHAWEHKLAPLHQMVSSVEPPAGVWNRIAAGMAQMEKETPPVPANDTGKDAVHAIDPVTLEMTSALEGRTPAAPAAMPELASEPAVADTISASAPPDLKSTEQSAFAGEPAVSPPAKGKSGSGFGVVMGAIAALLAAIAGLQIFHPSTLPAALRPKPEVRTVEVKIPPPPVAAQWVAALQSDARDPGFILTVDAASRRYTVRRVGPPPAAGKSYELWIVPGKYGEPRSIGVIDGEFTASGALTGVDAAAVNNSIYAVTVEAKGGSPSGKPTAQPLWAGKLYESVPAK